MPQDGGRQMNIWTVGSYIGSLPDRSLCPGLAHEKTLPDRTLGAARLLFLAVAPIRIPWPWPSTRRDKIAILNGR